jgi:hypothetical protein
MKFWIDLPMPSGKPIKAINPVAAVVTGVLSGLIGGLLVAACSALLR